MNPGDLIADQFELIRLAGAGGAGEVWQARDRAHDTLVALKILDRAEEIGDGFAREALILSELRHPGIVRYVAHGITPARHPYLAMEWLEGEDLSRRLERGALSIGDALTLLSTVTDALAAAHGRGVIHRDIKPSNIFLPDGSVARVKVLDFGVAKPIHALRRTPTAGGAIVGTPGYMAPEQARGGDDLDARADFFALGCVAFECLTGQRAFEAEHPIAALAKILLEDVPQLASRCPEAPAALNALVQRMLSKDPERRPRNALEIAAVLAQCVAGTAPAGISISPPLMREQRMIAVVLLSAAELPPTARDPSAQNEAGAIQAMVDVHGGRLEHLGDGSSVVLLTGRGSATQIAVQAARCALGLCAVLAWRRIALAMGQSDPDAPLTGDALDRAARQLSARAAAELAATPVVVIDEVTAGLLDARFEVVSSGSGNVLHGEREIEEAPRTLLGRATQCVGREREITALSATFDECAAESVARAVLVTAPAGQGKSRLRNELVARIRDRAEAGSGTAMAVWIGRGDPMRAESAFGLATQMLLHACGLSEGDPVERRRERLRARVTRSVRTDAGRVTEFLGELMGARFDDRASPQLRAARQDPVLLGDQMRRAWEDFLRGESERAPVLLVLEDAQWGDPASVQLIDAVLRNLRQRPIMVLALARPEVHDRFPRLWAERDVHEVRLAPLTRKASTRLVVEALGAAASDETVRRVVERAEGNAFYLEELVRSVAAGRGTDLPETIVATVQARIERLDAAARRILRASSVFGETFWQHGTASLLGSASSIDEWLAHLADEEIIAKRSVPRFAGEQEYVFRHALLREGAYAMLTQTDRAAGHTLAGEWLESKGERDAIVLAEHFERGGSRERAVRFYPRAAEQALEGNDLKGVLSRVERGIACGATGVEMGALRATEAEAHNWRGENADGERRALEAMTLLPGGCAAWYAAAREALITGLKLAHNDLLIEISGVIRSTAALAEGANARRMALGWAAMSLLFSGSSRDAQVVLDELDVPGDRTRETDARVEAVVTKARAVQAALQHRPEAIDLLKAALTGFEEAGDLRNASITQVDIAVLYLEVGAYEDAAPLFERALAESERMGLFTSIPQVKLNWGCALAGLGKLQEAEAMQREAAAALRAQGHPWLEAAARIYLARLFQRTQRYAEAEQSARAAIQLFAGLPDQAFALAALAMALLGQARSAEALDAAERAMGLLRAHGTLEEGESLVRLALAEALHACGDPRALSAIADATHALQMRAAGIVDTGRRLSFLERVEENSRTIVLAREWVPDL